MEAALNEHYIDGAFRPATGADRHSVVDPASEEVRGHLHLGSVAETDAAVTAARRAFPAFSTTSREERLALLQRIADIYKRRFADLGAAISAEMGAPLSFATKMQAGAGFSHVRTAIDVLKTYPFEEASGTTTLLREPIGVAGMITPWNWPANQITCKVAPALAAGCTMVLKPSEYAPLSARIIAEILHEAGVPAGVFNLVHGAGPVVGARLAAHPEVDVISFTGSTGAGIRVAELAAPTVKRVGQELGGKSANILLDDADLTAAVTQGVEACFRNAGQSCNAPTRLLVPAQHMSAAAEIAKATAERFRVGDPRAADTDMGPVVSAPQWQKIQGLIESGIAEGARLVTGGPGRPAGLQRGFFVRPTVFADVTPAMRIAREEIFGPVLSIMAYGDEAEAVAIANASEFGLAGYVTSADRERARRIARQLRCGMVHLNGAPADAKAPFGGYKQSGNGREWGRFGLEEYLEVKAVMGWGT